MALLVGATTLGAAAADLRPTGQAAAPTALLLRSRLAAAAVAPDADSVQFVAAFSQRVQQVACGVLPAAALLDSIFALLATSLVQLHAAASGDATGAEFSAALAASSSGCSLPQQRLRLLAAGLHVAQHLMQLDAGCAAAAAGASQSSNLTSAVPRLSTRVVLLNGSGVALPASSVPAAPWALPGSCLPGAASQSGSGDGLPSTAALVRQHAALFEGLAAPEASALLPVVLGVALELGPQHEAIAAGSLGALLAVARALRGEGKWAVLAPVFITGKPARRAGGDVCSTACRRLPRRYPASRLLPHSTC